MLHCAALIEVGESVKHPDRFFERATGRRVPAEHAERRPGDAPALVADTALVKREQGWTPQRSIDVVIADAWKWQSEVEARVSA